MTLAAISISGVAGLWLPGIAARQSSALEPAHLRRRAVFGNFQSALSYPPNWLYLVLPLGPATNWQIALHVFLGGLFMYLWASRRGLHPVACLAAAALLMFCSPMFLHIFAGHLCNFDALVWVPLLLLAIDGFFQAPGWGWCLAGMFAVAMEILAGHPQCVFYTVVTATMYACCCLPGRSDGR